MPIASAILAQTPYLYWKLDDGSGPAASDSSGNGRPGVYGGSFSLGVNGPEAATFACLLTGGSVTATTSLTGTVDQSIVLYAALAPSWPTGPTKFFGNADSSLTLRGLVGSVRNPGGSITIDANIFPFVTGAGKVMPQPQNFWHCIVLTMVGATKVAQVWLDGVAGPTVTTTTGVGAAVADLVQIASPFNVAVAHLALFNRVLTAGQIGGISAFVTSWPFGGPTNCGCIDPTDIATLLASATLAISDLTAISATLAAQSATLATAIADLGILRGDVEHHYQNTP
jgi:hypothetical protein